MRSLSLLDPTVMYVDTIVSNENTASIFRDKFMGVDVVMLHRHADMRVFIHIRGRVKKSKQARDTVFVPRTVGFH